MRTTEHHSETGTPIAPGTMTAVVQTRYGDAPEDVLGVRQVGRPDAGDGEVLVRVRAASVDRGTWHLMAGLPSPARLACGLRRPNFATPGRAWAGTVAGLGSGGTHLRPG